MRISTGATARCNIHLMKIEAKWEDIEIRRKNHVLIMFYRIMHSDTLTSLK